MHLVWTLVTYKLSNDFQKILGRCVIQQYSSGEQLILPFCSLLDICTALNVLIE